MSQIFYDNKLDKLIFTGFSSCGPVDCCAFPLSSEVGVGELLGALVVWAAVGRSGVEVLATVAEASDGNTSGVCARLV